MPLSVHWLIVHRLFWLLMTASDFYYFLMTLESTRTIAKPFNWSKYTQAIRRGL